VASTQSDRAADRSVRRRIIWPATLAAVLLLVLVMVMSAVDREAPYKVVAKPLNGRIHFGKDTDTPPKAEGEPAQTAARPSP